MILVLRRVFVGAAVATLVAVAAIGAARATSPTAASVPLPAAAGPLGAASTAPPAAVPATAPDVADDVLAADLDAVLAVDQASPSAAPGAGVRIAVRGELRRLAAWRKLVHATVVVDLPNRGLTTVQLDHGTVSAASATSLTIAESGGSVTVSLGGDTRVRRDGARATVADLKAGDEVFVMSKVEAGGTIAYLVVVPKR